MKIHEDFNSISTFIFDVDGVLTNSQMLLTESGELLRSMNTRDGLAIKIALRAGYNVGIITGGSSKGVKSRLQNLGIKLYFDGIQDKPSAFRELIEIASLKPSEILYMGDDLPDAEVMKMSKVGACPSDATEEVIAIADFICNKNGGEGCVREIIEKVLRLQNKWSY